VKQRGLKAEAKRETSETEEGHFIGKTQSTSSGTGEIDSNAGSAAQYINFSQSFGGG
jgi:hypothetical protein